MEACKFFDSEVWLRGIVDLLVVREDKPIAKVVDYKFGKSKNADSTQLELMALLVFVHYPQVDTVKGLLMFCAEQKYIEAEFHREDIPQMWQNWMPDVKRLESSMESGTWNPNPSGLCKGWCPVKTCQHWSPKR